MTKYGNSVKVKEDELQELNLGIDEEPIMVRVSIYVVGEILKELLQLLQETQEYKDVFAWDYDQVKGIDPNLHQHRVNLKADAVLIVQQKYRMKPNFSK